MKTPNAIPNPSHGHDADLLSQLQADNPQAFNQLYNKYRHWLVLVAVSILRKKNEAEDMVQEFFIDFWRSKLYRQITVSRAGSLKNFLFVSIKNRCLNQLAKDETRKKRFDQLMLPEGYILPENKLENAELRNRLEAAMDQLPARQAEVFKMAYLFQKTRKEIAAVMGISAETVKKQIAFALKTLRHYLKETEAL